MSHPHASLLSVPRIRVCEHGSSCAFEWISQGLCASLQALGYAVERVSGTFLDDGESLHIVLGANLYDHAIFSTLSGRCVIYNLEQVDPSVPWMNARYFSLMKRHVVWDYNERNVERLKRAGVDRVLHMPVGCEESQVSGYKLCEQDVDVLFFGTPSPRRNAIMDLLRIRGWNVFQTTTQALQGDALLDMMRRSKVGLNMHFYDQAGVFEDVRVAQMLANKMPVVAEVGPSTCIDGLMRSCVVAVPYEQLVSTCCDLVDQYAKREKQAVLGHERFRSRPLRPILEQGLTNTWPLLQQPPANSGTSATALPRQLQIGSGKKWRYDMVNLDVDASRGADWIVDLNQPLTGNDRMNSWRWGEVDIQHGMFDYILSEHVFEHIRELSTAMRTCLDLLSDGGILEIEVPYDLSFGAWQDPTHVRAFNQNSWVYYSEWCWYLGWRTHRFDLISQVFVTSAYGDSLIKTLGQDDIEALSRHPRAIDALRVKLRKRALTDQEKAEHRQYFQSDNFA